MTIPRISKKKLAKLGGKVPFSSITASRKAPRRNTKKKASNFKRQFHSLKRVKFVQGLPCAACGIWPWSENAHVAPPSEKGTGYRAGYKWIVPLCGPRVYAEQRMWLHHEIGCHRLYDEHRSEFDKLFPSFDSVEAARTCELAWQDHLTSASMKTHGNTLTNRLP